MRFVKYVSLAAIAASSFLFIRSVPAIAADTFVLDKAHTQIRFSVMRMGLTRISGIFKKFDGEVVFDEADVTKSSVKATIDTASLDSGFGPRNKQLRSPAFFSVKEFPTMTFKNTSITKTGANTGKMTGNLTLHGVTKSVTLDVVFNRKLIHPRNQKVLAGFSATGKINRSEFGITFLVPRISDEVQLDIQALTVKK